jgi:hypothetical protein
MLVSGWHERLWEKKGEKGGGKKGRRGWRGEGTVTGTGADTAAGCRIHIELGAFQTVTMAINCIFTYIYCSAQLVSAFNIIKFDCMGYK